MGNFEQPNHHANGKEPIMSVGHESDRLAPVVPPAVASRKQWRMNISPSRAFSWLRFGWHDLIENPSPSLTYGFLITSISFFAVWTLFRTGYDYILFPALSGFLVIAPLAATGLYVKSQRLSMNTPITLKHMVFAKVPSGNQIVFVGLILSLLIILWMRAAVLLYALFFGLLPFPGMDQILTILVSTSTGWALLAVGGLVGGVFAAFSFSISVFSIPMLLDERVDALTAMGRSMTLVWHNLPVMLVWGSVVLVFFILSIATGLLGLVVAFPVLGHATWHAYCEVYKNHKCGVVSLEI